MTTDVGGIRWTADIETQNLTSSERRVNASLRNVQGGFEETERRGDRLNTSMKRLAGAMASVFAVRQLQGFITTTINGIDAQSKFAQSIGITFESLQRLQFAAEQNGATNQELNASLERLSRNVYEAADGTGTAARALNRMGIDARALSRLNADEMFLEVADALRQVEDQGEQARMAYELFGRQGTRMLNTIRQGSAGIRELGDDAERTGRVLGSDVAANAEKFNDEMNRLRGAVGGAAGAIVGEMLPAVSSTIESFTNFIASGNTIENTLNLVAIAGASLATVFTARLLTSLYASAAQMIVNTRNAIAYQMALARMAGVSRTAAAGQMALAGALNVGRSAMALMGGPAGVIMLAAGALTYFIGRARRAKDESQSLTDTTELLSRSMDNLTAAQARSMRLDIVAEIDRHTKALMDQREQIQVLERHGEIFGKTGKASEDNLIRLRGELDTTGQALSQLYDRMSEVDSVINGTRRVADSVDGLSNSAQRAISPLQSVLNEMQRMRDLQDAGFDPGDDPFADPSVFTKRNQERIAAERELREQIRSIGVSASERELVRMEQDMEEQLRLLREAQEQELITMEEFEERKLGLSQEYSERRRKIMDQEAASWSDRLEEMGINFQSMQNQAVGSITGVALGFTNAKDAARDFARTALTQVVGAMVRMAIQAAVGQKAAAASGAATASALSAAYATPAALASLASFGANAAPAQAGIATTVATTKALSLGTGRLYGGNVNPGTLYPVSEDGRPELLMSGGKQYLLPGSRGEVISNRNMNTTDNSSTTINMPITIHGEVPSEQIRAVIFDSEQDIYNAVANAKAARGEQF